MINIGTNLLYNGKNFLDFRQGYANAPEDLKTWDLNIPPGFEVCVNGEWYIYSPEFEEDEITGKFRKRVDVELEGVDISSVQSQISELMDAVFPLSLSITKGGGTYETGSSITPRIEWNVTRKGVSVVPETATVNNSTEGIDSNKKGWTGSFPILSTTSYSIKVGYQGLEKSGSTTFTFNLRKYFGVSEKTTLTNSDILSFSTAWATSWTMAATTFNCTGGKYPYYIIPSSLYNPSTFKCWIGGLRNTDLITTTQNVTNSSGHTSSYEVIRLGTLQTGVLSIRFGD